MATQGIVSVLDVDGQTVLYKIIAGSDGYNAAFVAEWVKAQTAPLTMLMLYEGARKLHFGTEDNLVIQDAVGSLLYNGDGGIGEHGTLYRDDTKFRDPKFNPRWDIGIADYVELVTLVP